jgi:quinol monooxygenase YgiN
MWAQLITMRFKPGKEEELEAIMQQLQAAEPPGSGLIRQTVMRDQKDPSLVYTLVLFESEERARERENDSGRQEALKSISKLMMESIDGPSKFVDLIVEREFSQ